MRNLQEIKGACQIHDENEHGLTLDEADYTMNFKGRKVIYMACKN